jgi:hypothetical protein
MAPDTCSAVVAPLTILAAADHMLVIRQQCTAHAHVAVRVAPAHGNRQDVNREKRELSSVLYNLLGSSGIRCAAVPYRF